MNLRRINNTLEVSEIGLGLWSIVTDEWGANINKAEELLRKAYELGINFFDTADVYGKGLGEQILGKIFSTKRDRVIILTKIGLDFYNKQKPIGNYNLDYLDFAFRQSLERLKTDYIDILMLHNPKGNDIRNKEVFDFLTSLKKDGKVRMIGVALGPTLGWGEEGLDAIKMGYESLEYIYNLIEVKPGIDFLNYDIGHFIRVPHASDALNEDKWPVVYDPKLHRHFKDINWINRAVEISKYLIPFARKKNMKLSQLALKFILYNKKVSSVIPNITNEIELREFTAVENMPDLDESDYSYLVSFYEKYFKELNEESIEETKRYK
ncbi:aldo/keto reductase [Stygiolobus caldivivus]|uniref:Aldo/keto reductase n=1 Tax=Stygiolobus caldivivus TaxID=2824673 RepID=A0A8D5ZJU2_9CREN|nr:aldo/keto reductase [Stygiolobus caldivivus]BCU70710.1 aldo/keto reductase [Stygiolobus caldivivus]